MHDVDRHAGVLPVYAVPRGGAVAAAHPDHQGELNPATEEEELLRVGWARLDARGRYLISLTAVPLDGQVLFEPHATGEATPVAEEFS